MSNSDYETVLSSSEELEEFLLKNKQSQTYCSDNIGVLRFYTSCIPQQPLSEFYEIIWYSFWQCHDELPFMDFKKNFAFVDLADVMVLD